MKIETNTTAPFSEGAQCERCGKFGAFQFQDTALCLECYQNSGSCCPEFGADDLWKQREPHEK